jgi:hypothetical protein
VKANAEVKQKKVEVKTGAKVEVRTKKGRNFCFLSTSTFCCSYLNFQEVGYENS